MQISHRVPGDLWSYPRDVPGDKKLKIFFIYPVFSDFYPENPVPDNNPNNNLRLLSGTGFPGRNLKKTG